MIFFRVDSANTKPMTTSSLEGSSLDVRSRKQLRTLVRESQFISFEMLLSIDKVIVERSFCLHLSIHLQQVVASRCTCVHMRHSTAIHTTQRNQIQVPYLYVFCKLL